MGHPLIHVLTYGSAMSECTTNRVLAIIQFDWVMQILETDKHKELIG